MQDRIDFNRILFPLMFVTPGSLDQRLFYKFCIQAYPVCVAAELATLLALSVQQPQEREFVRSAFTLMPLVTSVAIVPLLLFSIYQFFRQVDFRKYRPLHWNPHQRFRKTGAVVRTSLAIVPVSLLILLFPQGLFLLLIEEYHVISETYFVSLIFMCVVAYVSPIMATFLFIALTALTTNGLQALCGKDGD